MARGSKKSGKRAVRRTKKTGGAITAAEIRVTLIDKSITYIVMFNNQFKLTRIAVKLTSDSLNDPVFSVYTVKNNKTWFDIPNATPTNPDKQLRLSYFFYTYGCEFEYQHGYMFMLNKDGAPIYFSLGYSSETKMDSAPILKLCPNRYHGELDNTANDKTATEQILQILQSTSNISPKKQPFVRQHKPLVPITYTPPFSSSKAANSVLSQEYGPGIPHNINTKY